MSIRSRFLALVAGFAVMALAIAVLGVVSIADYSRMLAQYTQTHETAHKAEHLNGLVSSAVAESRGIYHARNTEDAKLFAARLERNLQDIETVLNEPPTLSPELVTQTQAFVAFRRELIRLGTQVSPAAADRHGNNETNRHTRTQYQADLSHWVDMNRRELDRHREIARNYGDGRIMHFVVIVGFGLVSMIGLSLWWAMAYISRPMQTLAHSIIRVSEGDYDAPRNAPSDTRAGTEISAVWKALSLLADRAKMAEVTAKAERDAEEKRSLEMRQILLD
ncbi:hypothetical protein [Asticcacaulis endophyticus]|jgi:methyl-accepting chemotaxis protein|uniref:HAMP domain-containing protein n=1 Tax=Asticcacaulis endophyticus TaxID=1395890 RepID=A0A918Q0Z0_9CAUL|nr:hypothetical protein [Asticcacaulis endophyticus]GGZ30106.1 hypothetical protein GCM10011273_15380 [Asticcacaulis endophyticus]